MDIYSVVGRPKAVRQSPYKSTSLNVFHSIWLGVFVGCNHELMGQYTSNRNNKLRSKSNLMVNRAYTC